MLFCVSLFMWRDALVMKNVIWNHLRQQDLCVGSYSHKLNETFPYYEAHGNLFFSLNSFMPQKQPLTGSMQTVSQQTLWRGHHRKARIPASLQSGGKSSSHRNCINIQDIKYKGQISGPVGITNSDLMGLQDSVQKSYLILPRTVTAGRLYCN